MSSTGRGRAAAQSHGASTGSWARARSTGMAGALFALGRADGVGREGREGIGTKMGEGEMQGTRFWDRQNIGDMWGRDPHH